MSADAGPGRREVAQRLFAAEFDDATLSYSESDEERAPNYVVTPTGARINRLFAVGVFTEVEAVNDDVLRARVVDPSGAFVTYAGQYQPDEMAFLERTTPPAFLALTGKARTFEPDDSDRVYTSVRPESINEVDADTRDRWVVSTAEATLRRLAVMREALDADARGDDLTEELESRGVPPALAAGVPRAIDHYGTTPAYLEAVRRLAVDALEVVAGERDEVRSLDVAPGEGGDVELGPLPDAPFDGGATATEAETGAETEAEIEGGGDADAEPGTPATGAEAEPSEPDRSEPTAAERESTAHEPEAVEVGAGGGAEVSAESTGSGEGAPAGSDGAGDGLGEVDPAPAEGEGASADADVGTDTAATDADAETADAEASPSGVDETEMYEFDDEERREIEAQFDTGFSTGNEVSDPGEADIETPEPDSESSTEASGGVDTPGADEARGAVPDAESEPAPTETDAEAGTATDPSDAEAGADAEVDLESAAVEIMDELDDGDGADRERVVAALVDRRGADPDAAEGAIQDALMSGRCYEAGEGTLKPI